MSTANRTARLTETQRRVIAYLDGITGRRNAAEIARSASPSLLYIDVVRACEQLERRGILDGAPAPYAGWVREYRLPEHSGAHLADVAFGMDEG